MINHKYIFSFVLVILNFLNLDLYAFEKKNRFFSISKETNIDDISDQSFFEDKYIKRIDRETFGDLIKDDFEKLNTKLSNLISENNETGKIEQTSTIEVIADTQFEENGIFKAEGNVVVFFKNGELKTDNLTYDRENKIIKAQGNITFFKGKQFFEANYLEYNSESEKGYLDDIYGVVNFVSLEQDLNLDLIINKNEICNAENLDLINLPSEIRLLNSSNIRFKNKFGLDAINLNFTEIKRWRFKSKRIYISSNKWTSDMINFTNDPFNQPQFYVNSKNFSGEIINGRTVLKSRSTFLNFENKVSIPVGKRTISDDLSTSIWGLGYETNEKDGLYLIRNNVSIFENENLSFDLRPYFLIQRAIMGESNAFRSKGSPVLSDNVNTDISALDFFALKGTLEGNLFNSNINLETNIKTLNPDRFFDSFSSKFNLLKNIYKSKIVKEKKLENICTDNVDNNNPFTEYKTDLGVYAILDDSSIHSAYGTKIINNYKYKKGEFSKDYSLVFDIGNFQAKSLENSNNLKLLDRYSLNTSFTHNYRIYKPNKRKTNFDNQFKFVPEIVDQGIFLTANLSTGINEYSNNQSQSIIQASLGPTFVYGDHKDKFLDYTLLSLIPEYAYKRGKSPFSFDDFNDNSRLKINLKQQIYGPLLIGFGANLNLNNSSDNYGTLESKKYSLSISRRAYLIDFVYDVDEKYILFNFNIFNFGYDKFSPKF